MIECRGFLGPSVIVLRRASEDQRRILSQSLEGVRYCRNISVAFPVFALVFITGLLGDRTKAQKALGSEEVAKDSGDEQ